MNRLNRFVTGFLLAAGLLTLPSLSMGEQPPLVEAPTPSVRPDHRKIPYVRELLIDVVSDMKPGFGKRLSSGFMSELSQMAGVKLTYIRNGNFFHVIGLPKSVYEADAESLCAALLRDARVTSCSPAYRVQLESVTNPNDPVYANGQQWNLRNESPAGIDAVSAWKQGEQA